MGLIQIGAGKQKIFDYIIERLEAELKDVEDQEKDSETKIRILANNVDLVKREYKFLNGLQKNKLIIIQSLNMMKEARNG